MKIRPLSSENAAAFLPDKPCGQAAARKAERPLRTALCSVDSRIVSWALGSRRRLLPPTSKLFRSLNFQLLSSENPTDFGIKMVRVFWIFRPVSRFPEVGNMFPLLRCFHRLCRLSALFSEHTELPVCFRILGTPAAAHGSSACTRGCSCGKSRCMFCVRSADAGKMPTQLLPSWIISALY